VNFLGGKAKNWPYTSGPNADACWLMKIIAAGSACIAMLKILFVTRPDSQMKNCSICEMVNCLVSVILK
jgi:hypothetical protein